MARTLPVSDVVGAAATAVKKARDHGQATTITSRGRPVARIVPASTPGIRWGTGQMQTEQPLDIPGVSLAEVVLEDRR